MKLDKAEWGEGVVDELAAAIARQYPGQRGFTRPNLFRMKQLYEAYRDDEKVSPLVRQLPVLGPVKASSALGRIHPPRALLPRRRRIEGPRVPPR